MENKVLEHIANYATNKLNSEYGHCRTYGTDEISTLKAIDTKGNTIMIDIRSVSIELDYSGQQDRIEELEAELDQASDVSSEQQDRIEELEAELDQASDVSSEQQDRIEELEAELADALMAT